MLYCVVQCEVKSLLQHFLGMCGSYMTYGESCSFLCESVNHVILVLLLSDEMKPDTISKSCTITVHFHKAGCEIHPDRLVSVGFHVNRSSVGLSVL